MRKFAYFYSNSLDSKKDPKKEDFYEGERVLNKSEEVKYEDYTGNVEYDSKCYITNFRILNLSDKYIFDVPLCFIKTHYVKKPMVYGSNYIYIEFYTDIKYKTLLPTYLKENISQSEINTSNYSMPKYAMLKFRGKDSNIDQSYNILKIALNGKEWNKSFIKQQIEQNKIQENNDNIYKSSTDHISGLGLERTKNIIKSQMNEQNQIISGSFSDIQSLKTNAQQMIDLAKQIKSKLGSSLKNDPMLNEINLVLTSIGFVDPVTRETSGKSYFADMAKQINEYFTKYFANSDVQILSLIDAYCIYNRSRGMNTISPGDMKMALDQFKYMKTSIIVKTFKNDMIMLFTSDYSLENLLIRIKNYFSQGKDYVTLKDFSELTTKNQLLSKILIDEMIEQGYLLIDESDLELRFYYNRILHKV